MTVEVTTTGRVARLLIDRPSRRNALDRATRAALLGAIREVGATHEIAVVILQSSGPVFCAGIDTREAPLPSLATTRHQAHLDQRMIEELEALCQVTIAAVQGPAVGSGVVLALACDLRVATTSATFSVPELRHGHALAWGAVPLLVRAVGLSRARDLVLGDRVLDAPTAAAWGIVQRVVPDSELDGVAGDLARGLSDVPVDLLAQTKSALVSAHLPGAAHADPDRSLAAIMTATRTDATDERKGTS